MTHSKNLKPVNLLTVEDLQAAPVWEFSGEEYGVDETYVSLVEELPVSDPRGKVFGTQVQFANGSRAWATLGNIRPDDPRHTQHVLVLSIERNGEWFHLARYHDFDFDRRGPDALSRFLDLPIDEVFPISYDIRELAHGDPAALAGRVLKEPTERLSRREISRRAIARRRARPPGA
jgi:hypothetical protein